MMSVVFTATIMLIAVVFRCQCVTIQSCWGSKTQDYISLTDYSIEPSVIRIPGTLSVSASITVKQPIQGELQADVDIKKKFGLIWISLPCTNNYGSCTYRNLCDLLASTCPEIVKNSNFPCFCPVLPGTYNFPKQEIQIGDNFPGFTSFALMGEYKVTVRLIDQKTWKQIACYEGDFQIIN